MVADTREGALGPMAAPSGCLGPYHYADVIKHRYTRDHKHREQISFLARHLDKVQITGPFTAEARALLEQYGPTLLAHHEA